MLNTRSISLLGRARSVKSSQNFVHVLCVTKSVQNIRHAQKRHPTTLFSTEIHTGVDKARSLKAGVEKAWKIKVWCVHGNVSRVIFLVTIPQHLEGKAGCAAHVDMARRTLFSV